MLMPSSFLRQQPPFCISYYIILLSNFTSLIAWGLNSAAQWSGFWLSSTQQHNWRSPLSPFRVTYFTNVCGIYVFIGQNSYILPKIHQFLAQRQWQSVNEQRNEGGDPSRSSGHLSIYLTQQVQELSHYHTRIYNFITLNCLTSYHTQSFGHYLSASFIAH